MPWVDMTSVDRLPDFSNPPVTEVILCVQFAPVEKLTGAHLGLYWSRIQERFPSVEQHAPVEHSNESFGQFGPLIGKVKFHVLDAPPVPRFWFKTADDSELIQMQADRLMHNWRKTTDADVYPRYEEIRKRFSAELYEYQTFLDSENLGRILPDQCEVTYINHIFAGKGWHNISDLKNILTLWRGDYSSTYLSGPEDIRLSQRHIITRDNATVGRLYIEVQSALSAKEKVPVFVLTLTARTQPKEATIEAALDCLDLGREWIVNSFASITTPDMHTIWERNDAT